MTCSIVVKRMLYTMNQMKTVSLNVTDGEKHIIVKLTHVDSWKKMHYNVSVVCRYISIHHSNGRFRSRMN